MPNNMSADQLALFREYLRNNYNPTGMVTGAMQDAPPVGPNGDTWHAGWTGGWQGGEAGAGEQPTLTGFFRDVVPGRNDPGFMQEMYGTDGYYKGTDVIPENNALNDFILAAAVMAGPFALTAMGAGAAAGAAGVGEAGWGMGLDSMGGIGGGSGALEAAGGAAGTAGAGGYGGAANGMWDILPEAVGTGGGTGAIGSGAAGVGATGAGGGGTTGGMGGLLGAGGGSNLLGTAATVLGGLAGSQGQETGGTTRNEIDPRLVPYLYGNNGLMQQTQQQLAVSRGPDRADQWAQMRNQGLGLLQQPIAGNQFSRFFPGR